MKRKTLSLILSAAVAASVLFTGCGAKDNKKEGSSGAVKVSKTDFPIVNKDINLTMMGAQGALHGPWNQMLVFKEYQKKTNVKVKFETTPDSDYKEKLSLTLASDELPDALIRTYLSQLDVAKYGPSGTLVALDKYIDEGYAPNFKALLDKYPEIKASITASDGHIYALPAVVDLNAARDNKLWINKEWLQKYNLKAPTTLAETEKVLETFKEKNKGAIPLAGQSLGELVYDLQPAFGLQNQLGSNINIENNKVKVWLTDDRYKNLLMYLHELYSKKLISDSVFSTDSMKQFLANLSPDKTGMFFNQADDAFKQYADKFEAITPLKGFNGEQGVSSLPLARDFGTFAITSADKYPEATMRWIDYFYGDEGSMFLRMGVEGNTYEKKSDGTYDYTDKVKNDSKGESSAIAQFTIWPGGGAPQLINKENSIAINDEVTQKAQTLMDPYLNKKVYGAPIFDQDTAQQVSTLTNDINTYVSETQAKFITGHLSFNKWNQYVATLKKMNLDQLQKFYQDAFDKVNK